MQMDELCITKIEVTQRGLILIRERGGSMFVLDNLFSPIQHIKKCGDALQDFALMQQHDINKIVLVGEGIFKFEEEA